MRESHSGSSLSGDSDSTTIYSPSSPFFLEDSNGLACQSRDGPTHPINHVPSEVLSEIFLHCVSFPPDPYEPLILSQVCHEWRAVALKTPALWDTINLPIPGIGLGFQHVRLVDIFLKRSGMRLLKVDLGLVTGISPWTTAERHLKLLDDVVQALTPHVGRIRVLENVVPNHLLHRFRLSRLNRIDELLVCEDEKSSLIDYPPDENQFSDTLRVLDLCGTMFDVRRVELPRTLSELYVREPVGDGQVSVPQSIGLFSVLSRLTQCSLDITRQPETPAENSLQWLQRVDLPNLEVLYVSWSRGITVGPILDVLAAPKLSTLGLRTQFNATIPWAELRNFVRNETPPLSILSLIGSGTIDPSFAECLKQCPELENLTLSGFALDSTFLDALTFRYGENTERLLQKLEYLDFEWCTFPDFARLVLMLKSRGSTSDPSYQNGRLKYFRMRTDMLSNEELKQLQDCGIECFDVQRY